MPRAINTRKKRKILELTAQGASLGQIQKQAYVSRPVAIKYRRMYRKELEQAESTIVQKIAEPKPKESLISTIKRRIFGKMLTMPEREAHK